MNALVIVFDNNRPIKMNIIRKGFLYSLSNKGRIHKLHLSMTTREHLLEVCEILYNGRYSFKILDFT